MSIGTAQRATIRLYTKDHAKPTSFFARDPQLSIRHLKSGRSLHKFSYEFVP